MGWYRRICFPPLFAQIGKVLKKVQEENCKIVLVAPDWPSSPWYSRMRNMAIDTPIIVPARRHLLSNTIDEQAQPERADCALIVCCIRALGIKKTFHRESETSFMSTPGVNPLELNISCILKSGENFVKERVKITLIHL